ncbi:Hypothetical_protein [Hexamita inflata]|uniref:Hypothetical_protein n=1 Tax=Hexamita inflata TaxID=28002 RepID=A0ABP1HY48_9EUKA
MHLHESITNILKESNDQHVTHQLFTLQKADSELQEVMQQVPARFRNPGQQDDLLTQLSQFKFGTWFNGHLEHDVAPNENISLAGHLFQQSVPSEEVFKLHEQSTPVKPLAMLHVQLVPVPIALAKHSHEETLKILRAFIDQQVAHQQFNPTPALSLAQSYMQNVWFKFKQPGQHAVRSTQAV